MEPLLLIKPISAFKNENVLYIEGFLTLLIFAYCYYQCKVHQNVSHTDLARGAIPIIWSLTANLHYWYHQEAINTRLLSISLLITIWGVHMVYFVTKKLTKRGQFQQDSRWSVLYTFIYHPKWPYIWELFVFFGVNLLQIVSWSLMVNMPLFMVYAHPQSSSLLMDSIFLILFLSFLTMEIIADQQMLTFKVVKFQKMLRGHSIRYQTDEMIVEKGSTFYGWKYDFLMSGLRKYCQHPNYFGEMGLWGCFYCFGASNAGLCWVSVLGLIGYLSLCLKLYKLAEVTEGILAYSYGSYYRYHATNNRFIPWPWPKELDLDESVSDDNHIEERYLSEKLLIRLRRMDKYRIFHLYVAWIVYSTFAFSVMLETVIRQTDQWNELNANVLCACGAIYT